MSLTKHLRKAGYDLIKGPVRNHKPLQLWLKQPSNRADLYYTDIKHAFKSPVKLKIVDDPALRVDTTETDSYGFNLGLTVLDDILKSIGVGQFDLSASIKSGKKISISYDNSVTRIIPTGELTNYLSEADFLHPNPVLLRNANRDNLLVITGVVMAKNLVVEFDTDFTISADLEAELTKSADGKLGFTRKAEQKLEMVSQGNVSFPIAVKAHRIDFDNGVFNGLTLISDNRDMF